MTRPGWHRLTGCADCIKCACGHPLGGGDSIGVVPRAMWYRLGKVRCEKCLRNAEIERERGKNLKKARKVRGIA